MTRAPVYNALFAKLTGLAPFVATGRRLPPWYDVVPADQMPACFLALETETPRRLASGKRLVWTCAFTAYLYVASPEGVEPMIAFAPLVDALEVALAPSPAADAQTLGGLCDSCGLAGAIEYYEGTLGDVAMAKVPLVVEVTP